MQNTVSVHRLNQAVADKNFIIYAVLSLISLHWLMDHDLEGIKLTVTAACGVAFVLFGTKFGLESRRERKLAESEEES